MNWLSNTWYVAGWSDELADELLPRKILGENVLLYRDSKGTAVAIADVCPHRFAPLHRGRLKGDLVECGYHGLQFDATGACVVNPHGNHAIPRNCRVKSYALVERHGVLWIWPGERSLADDSAIADFSYLADPARRTVHGSVRLRANYELVSDNLMDASHTQYVHMDLLGTDAFAQSRHEVIQDGNAVHSNYYIPRSAIPEAYRPYFADPEQIVDFSICFRWLPPALVRNNVSLVPVGQPAERGIHRTGSHFMTPESEFGTHYFFSHTRNFELDNPAVDERIRRWQQTGLMEQDGSMIEAVQEVMGSTDLDSLSPVLFGFDNAAVRVRRVLTDLVAKERTRPAAAAE